MTWKGAFTSSIASSTTTVTQRQHGHMHDNNNLRFPSAIHRKREIEKWKEKKRRGWSDSCPTIHTTTPTREMRRAIKAKGSPRSQPMGRHSQSESQHMFFSSRCVSSDDWCGRDEKLDLCAAALQRKNVFEKQFSRRRSPITYPASGLWIDRSQLAEETDVWFWPSSLMLLAVFSFGFAQFFLNKNEYSLDFFFLFYGEITKTSQIIEGFHDQSFNLTSYSFSGSWKSYRMLYIRKLCQLSFIGYMLYFFKSCK